MPHSHNRASRLLDISSVFQTEEREEIKKAKDMLAKTVSFIRKANTFPGAIHN